MRNTNKWVKAICLGDRGLMLEQLRKRNLKTTRIWLFALIASVIVILLITWNSLTKLIAGPQQLDSLAIEELSDSYVNGDITAIVGLYAEYYEEYDDGTETTTANYYVIPVGEYEFIGLHVSEEDFAKADQIYNETMDYLLGNTVDMYSSLNITGTINPMESELHDFYVEWFKSYGYTDEEINQVALPYVLQVGYIGQFDSFSTYGLLAVCAVALLLVIILILQMLSKSYLSRIKKFIKNSEDSASMERIEADYEGATPFGSITIGNLYTHYFQGNKAWILKNSDMIWAYMLNVTHRTYGIKVGVTKTLIVYTKNKKKYSINLKKSDDVTSILNKLSEINSTIVTGYSDELKKLFKKDFDSFVNLRYSQESASTNDTTEYNDTTY